MQNSFRDKFTQQVSSTQASFASRMESPRILVYFLLLCMLLPYILPLGTYYIKGASLVIKALYEAFQTQQASTKQIATTEKAIKELAFDHYHESHNTESLEALDINYFEQVINDIAYEMSIPLDIKKAILRGKHARIGEKNFEEFTFNSSDKGRFLYGKTITMKRDNGKEIDFAYAIYRVDFVLSKVKHEVVKERSPIAKFIFGVEKEIKYEDKNLNQEDKESMHGYFRKRCLEGISREYPQIAADKKRKIDKDEF